QFEPKDRPSVEEALEVLLNSPECVTPCLEEAPPQQPLEALRSSGDHLNLRGLGRHASGDRASRPSCRAVPPASSAARHGARGLLSGLDSTQLTTGTPVPSSYSEQLQCSTVQYG
uniref:Protein kinase domain-containing protein n=1 Tax=Macrostomum lignano TaxID=282301 RepID=A0A1I8HFD9_9PLAT